MPTLRVMFFGLICHVGVDPDKQQADHAVFVNAPGHDPLLVWWDGNDEKEVPLAQVKGRDIYIGSLSTKPLLFSENFQRYVVKLPDLIPSKKTVKSNVKDRDEEVDVHAYLLYPREADELTVAQVYPKIGLHKTVKGLPLRRNCVARLTITKFETHGKTIEIGYVDDDEWHVIAVVPSEGCILFSNAERPKLRSEEAELSPSRTDRNHVRHYSKITRDPVKVIADDTEECTANVGPFPQQCSWVERYLKKLRELRVDAAETVECGNSSEP